MSDVAIAICLLSAVVAVFGGAILFRVGQMVELLRVITNGSHRPKPPPPAGKAALLTLALAGAGWASSPAEAVAAAYADAQKVPAPARPYQRYATGYWLKDAAARQAAKRQLDKRLNELSLNTDLYPSQEVAPGLWRIDVRNYAEPPARDGGLFGKTWEKLAGSDPHFHSDLERVRVDAEAKPVEYEWKKVEWEGGDWPNSDGSKTYYAKGAFTYLKKVPKAPAEAKPAGRGGPAGVDPKKYAGLVEMTQSEAPIVRFDWFVVETGQQVEREGTGYFDWLGVKSRDDFDRLAGLDKKLAQKREREVRGIVTASGVALNDREIVIYDTLQGPYYQTLDAVKQARRKDNERRNAVRNLDGARTHDAEELFAFNAAGMLIVFAGSAKGERQDSVPDNVAADRRGVNNDLRIHPWNCFACHKEGIRPVPDEFARRLYALPAAGKGGVALSGPDYEKQRRLRKLYLSDLDGKIKEGQERYAKALFALTGAKPEEMATGLYDLHAAYSRPLGIPEAALELGVTQAHLLGSLKAAATALQKHGYYLDPSFAGLLRDPPIKMRRDYWDELFQTAQLYAHGIVQIPKPIKKED